MMHTHTATFCLFVLSCLLLIGILSGVSSVRCAELGREEAEAVLADTITIASYLELYGEPDYTDPSAVIRAALFGAYDAKNAFSYQESMQKEQGSGERSPDTPLFTVAGHRVGQDEVVQREENAALFADIPPLYTTFLSKNAVEAAALRYTGHSITEHTSPGGEGFLGDSLYTEKGYYVHIEGLGDTLTEPKLGLIETTPNGYVLHAYLLSILEEDAGEEKESLTVTLTPGDESGTWKRTITGKPVKNTD